MFNGTSHPKNLTTEETKRLMVKHLQGKHGFNITENAPSDNSEPPPHPTTDLSDFKPKEIIDAVRYGYKMKI